VNRHRFDADPDPDTTFYFDADPDPDPLGIKTMPIRSQVLNKLEYWSKSSYFYSQYCQLTLFSFSHQSQMSHDFKYFEQHIEVFMKK
jgi:hypothetical protein